MSALLAMIFAASLSSTDIDEFFTLPAWLPDEVSSDDTPGSDPEWYVEEYTNGFTFSSWVATDESGSFISNEQPTWDPSGVWHLPFCHPDLSDTGWYYMWTDPYDVYSTWDALHLETYEVYKWGGAPIADDMRIVLMNFDRELVPTNCPSGKYCPKAARLTTDVQSGILSTFAAYCERQYYASQGQSNEWDEAVYGPRFLKKKFRFGHDAHYECTVETNVVAWEVESSVGRVIIDGSGETYVSWSGGAWDVEGLSRYCFTERLHNRAFYVSSSPTTVSGDESDESVSGSVLVNFGYWLPNGTREYGSSNVTFTATKVFRYTTNETYVADSEFSYVPTNRTVTSRRLLQYDNIKTLAEFIRDRNNKQRFAHTASYRPGWHWMNYTGRWPHQNYTRLWWSTTDDSMLSDDYIVPSFDWIEDPFSNCSNQWAQSSLTFENVGTDPVWFVSERDVKEDRFTPTYALMSRLDFGQRTEIYDTETYCWPDWIGTMTQQLAQVYTHADPCAITNDTRRLQSDRLSNVNQVLGLMDRTYHVPEVIYPTVATNYNYWHHAGCSGTLYIDHYSENTATGEIEAYFSNGGHAVWDSVEYTNGTNVEKVVDDGLALHYAFSGTRTDRMHLTNGTFSAVACAYIGSDELVKGLIMSTGFSDYDLYTVEFSVTRTMINVNNGNFIIGGYVTTTNESRSVGYGVLSPLSSEMLVATFEHRQYDFHLPYGDLDLGITQPGFEGFSRSDCRLATVRGYHLTDRTVATSRWGQMLDNDTYDVYRYKSDAFTYSDRNGLLYDVRGAQDTFWNIFCTHAPNDLFNWRSLIPITDFEADCNTIVAATGRLTASATGSTTVECFYDPGQDNQFRIVSIRSQLANMPGVVVSNYVNLAEVEITADYSSSYNTNKYNEATPVALDGRVGGITRTDWDWDTLKRSGN